MENTSKLRFLAQNSSPTVLLSLLASFLVLSFSLFFLFCSGRGSDAATAPATAVEAVKTLDADSGRRQAELGVATNLLGQHR